MERESVAKQSDSEQSEQSEVDHSQQDRRPSSAKSCKKAKHRSSKSGHEDISDSETSREPLGETFYSNKQSQRANQHPKMARTRHQKGAEKATKGSRKRDRQDDGLAKSDDKSISQVPQSVRRRQKLAELEAKQAQQEAENKRVRAELARYQARENAESKVAALPRRKKKEEVKGTHSAISNMVKETTKTDFFKIAKFVSNDKQTIKATRRVMEFLDIDELKGLEGTNELIGAEEEWMAKWKDTVRKTLNEWRNYTAGELQKLLKNIMELSPDKMEDVPNPEQLAQLVMREGILVTGAMTPQEVAEVEQNQRRFDFYWDRMTSKVAGHKCWGAGKRHYGLMSTYRKTPDSELFVTPSDEAFLIVVWENNFKRWKWLHEQEVLEKKKEEEKAKKKAAGAPLDADNSGKVSEDDEKDDDSDKSDTEAESCSTLDFR